MTFPQSRDYYVGGFFKSREYLFLECLNHVVNGPYINQPDLLSLGTRRLSQSCNFQNVLLWNLILASVNKQMFLEKEVFEN